MTTSHFAGPSATTAWKCIEIASESSSRPGKTTRVLLQPDVANTDDAREHLFYYLLKTPRLAATSTGEPVLSLTLELSRPPTTTDSTIHPLVRRGWLAMTLSLGLSRDQRSALEAVVGSACRPLFARSVRVELFAGDTVLASVDGAGPEASIALSVTLNRDAALAVLDALEGAPTDLRVRAELRYRTAPTSTFLQLQGSFAEMHDLLAEQAGPDGVMERDTVRQALNDLLRLGILSAQDVGNDDAPPRRWTDTDALFPRFLSAASFVLENKGDGKRFALRKRPNTLMRLNVSDTIEVASERQWTATFPLEEIVGGALDGLDRERFLHLVAPDSGGEMSPVRRLIRSRRPARSRGPNRNSLGLASSRDGLTSLALAMTVDRTRVPSANALLSTDFVRAEHATSGRLWLADDLIIDRLETPVAPSLLSLPIIEDPNAPLWPDRVDAGRYWYAPLWTPVLPAPADDPSTAAFVFQFESSGVTGGASPAVGLNGMIRFTLRQSVPAPVLARLGKLGNPPARSVPIGSLSVSLDLPFRDEETGQTRRQLFPAEARQDGETITATISLLNHWVRLCYGSLAYAGFQNEPARLRVAYAYRAYVPVWDDRLELAFGGKIALTEIVATARLPERVVQPVFVPSQLTFHLPNGGALRLAREAPRQNKTLRGASSVMLAKQPSASAVMIAATTPMLATALVARPELTHAADVIESVRKVRYATRTFVHDESADALYPCANLGAFYRQTIDGEDTAVGCRETLRLGETIHRQYEEMPDLRETRYRVYQSLQQPGRVLVVPSAYRITRFGAAEPSDRAYRPAIMIYALLGGASDESRYFFRATLEPDLPPFVRYRLLERLAPLTPHGGTFVLDYPTDPTLQSPATPTTYRWALPAGIDTPEVLQTWDGFQISLSTGLLNALALTTLIESSGLTGDVTFTLPDGRELTSALALDTMVTGPWTGGAVSTTLTGTSARLVNNAECAVNVFDLIVRAGNAPSRHVPVNLNMLPGTSADVPLDGPADTAYASYEPSAERLRLRQMNIFEEDVTTNVIFVNLINYANHELKALKVKTRLKDTDHQYVVDIKEADSASITMTLPLTTYLDNQILQFQIVKTFTGSNLTEETQWADWDLGAAGNVISLTWDVVD